MLLCECLSAISSQRSDLLPSLAPDFSQCLRHMLPSQDSPHKNKLLVSLLTLLLQASIEEGLAAEDCQLVQEVVGMVDGWTAYKIARQAARYGHHKVASEVLAGLATQVGNCFQNMSISSDLLMQQCSEHQPFCLYVLKRRMSWLIFFPLFRAE